MSRRIKSKLLLSLGTFTLLSLSAAAYAETNISKDTWLKTFRSLAPAAMCQGIINGEKTGTLLKEKNISLEKCKPLIAQSLDRCLVKFSGDLPSSIGVDQSKTLGEKLGRCSGEDFYTNYIAKSS